MKNPRTKTVVLIYVIAFEQEEVISNGFQELVDSWFLLNEEIVGTTLEVQLEVGHDTSQFLNLHNSTNIFLLSYYLMITVAQTVYPNYYLNSIGYLVALTQGFVYWFSLGRLGRMGANTRILQGDRFSLSLAL